MIPIMTTFLGAPADLEVFAHRWRALRSLASFAPMYLFLSSSFFRAKTPGSAKPARVPNRSHPFFIASISIAATSGRENSRGGISAFANISRTFVPESVTCSAES